MCGIAGILSPSSPVSPDRLKGMTHALAHRGPNGEGHWINDKGNIGLGHRRLSILDLSDAGQQPMHCLGRYHITHNGEIYNYIELRDELKKKGYVFHTGTDTEVVAAAYDHYGEDCLDHFNGMFAFAIWDEKEQTLFAARDRFGEKPFFFIHTADEFLFASEIKAFWAAGLEKKINRRLLFNYLTIGYVDNPTKPEETFFESIRKLPAAHFLTYAPATGQLHIERYWQLEIQDPLAKISPQEAGEQFIDLLNTSVRLRLRSDVPVGTSLSGGLDSSSIIALLAAQTHSPNQFQSFSAVFPGFEKNEEPFIDEVCAHFDWPNIKSSFGEDSIAALIEKVSRHLDEPFGSASNLAQYVVYASARQNGVSVLLDGQGADEVLAGYNKYYKWYWQELFRHRKLMISGELKAARALGNTEPFRFNNIIAALFPDLASVVLEQQYLLKAVKNPALNPNFTREQSRDAYLGKPAISTLNEALYYNTTIHGLEELLRYADRNSMAHGVEVRLPYLDHHLVEFLFTLPGNLKIRNGYTKWLLRDAMKERLPSSITWRTDKVGFEPPQKKWMALPAVQSLIQQSKQKLVKEEILNDSVLKEKPQPHSAYAAEAYDWRYLAAGFLY